MVFNHQNISFIVQLFFDSLGNPDFFFQPEREGLEKGRKRAGKSGQIAVEYPLELNEGFLIKTYIVQILSGDFPLFEAVVDGVCREGKIVFIPAKALLLGAGDHSPVLNQTSRRIVIKG